MGWSVETCSSAEEALELTRSRRFDLMILDEDFSVCGAMEGSEMILKVPSP